MISVKGSRGYKEAGVETGKAVFVLLLIVENLEVKVLGLYFTRMSAKIGEKQVTAGKTC